MKNNRKILLPILAGLLGLGMLSGCGGSNTAQTTGTTGTATTTTSVPAETELDLTLPPLPHQAVTATDAEVLEIANVANDFSSVTEIRPEIVAAVKDIISKSYLTASQITMMVTCAKDFRKGMEANTYAEATPFFTACNSNLKTVLEAVDGDQIGYLIQSSVTYFQRELGRPELPSGLIFGIRTAADYQSVLSAFSASYPDFRTQFNLYSSYFDGTTAYREDIDAGNLALNTSFALALGRAIRALLLSALTIVPLEERVFGLAVLANAIKDEDLKYQSEVEAKIDALKDSPVSLINHLGSLLLSFRITKNSWTAIRDHVIWLLKGMAESRKGVSLTSRAINLTYLNGLISFVDSKKSLFDGDMLAVAAKLLGSLAANFAEADFQAIMKAQESTPANPVPQLLALYDRVYATFSAEEKTTISNIFTSLGLNYANVYQTVTGWKLLDFGKQADVKSIQDYLSGLAKGIVALFTPSVTKPDIDIYVIDPYFPKGSTIQAKRFDIELNKPGDSTDNYVVSDIVAATTSLGFNRGTFRLTDIAASASYEYAFGYDVVPTFVGIDPTQYPSFYSASGIVSYENRILYLQQGTTMTELKNCNVSNFRFIETDGNDHNVAFSDPNLSLVLSSTALGDCFLLLAYRVNSSLTIYGVMKVHIFAPTETFYSNGNQITYVVQNGDSTISVFKQVMGVNGYGVTLYYLYIPLSSLGIAPSTLGDGTYNATYDGHTFTVKLRVMAAAVCQVSGIAEFAPYLKTTYLVGEAFSLTALKVLYTYKDEGGSVHSAGTGLIEYPAVVLSNFSTAVPVSNAMATVYYGNQSFTFFYTVKMPDH